MALVSPSAPEGLGARWAAGSRGSVLTAARPARAGGYSPVIIAPASKTHASMACPPRSSWATERRRRRRGPDRRPARPARRRPAPRASSRAGGACRVGHGSGSRRPGSGRPGAAPGRDGQRGPGRARGSGGAQGGTGGSGAGIAVGRDAPGRATPARHGAPGAHGSSSGSGRCQCGRCLVTGGTSGGRVGPRRARARPCPWRPLVRSGGAASASRAARRAPGRGGAGRQEQPGIGGATS